MRTLTLVLSFALLYPGCRSTPKDPAAKAAQSDVGWSGQMQGLAQDVKKLLPYLYNGPAYADPKNKAEIEGYLKEFSQVAHRIQPQTGKKFIGDDLLIEYSLAHLKDDLTRAISSFDNGQVEYSRSVAKASLANCFQCHSVTKPGSSAAWNLDDVHHLDLAPLEKADLLVATRKYERALAFMEKKLTAPDFAPNDAFEFENLLRRYLALTIRVERAPDRAARELDKLRAGGRLAPYIREQTEGWKASLDEWRREKKSTITSSAALFNEVEKRFKQADQRKHFEKDHAGDVEYLRATELLHQDMALFKTPADEARALYLLGRAYEVLDDLGSWNLHESYFEACINKEPKAAVAKQCFQRLEASLTQGYSGSSGVHLPAEEKSRLDQLRQKLE